jgi:hypothetical protein
MIASVEKEDVLPVCPHCNEVVDQVWYRRIQGILGKRYIYFCARCRKVLGVTHRKGFWMG